MQHKSALVVWYTLDVSSNINLVNLECYYNPDLTKLFLYTGQTISDLKKDDFTIIYYKQPSINSTNYYFIITVSLISLFNPVIDHSFVPDKFVPDK